MTTIKLLLVTALAVIAAAIAGRTLSSDPEWRSLGGKGTDVGMEELTLSAQGSALTGDVAVSFKSDYFPLKYLSRVTMRVRGPNANRTLTKVCGPLRTARDGRARGL
jgi:hypothetical protein